MSVATFVACEICGVHNWTEIHKGKVRDGAFGRFSLDSTVVCSCNGCGVQRLNEESCHNDDIYTSTDYRKLLGQGDDAASFFEEHDKLQLKQLEELWPFSIRNKVLVDVGCAAGSFLDHVSGLAKKTIAIDPCLEYHESLQSRGHKAYSSCHAAIEAGVRDVDFAFSLSVIEHVGNPKAFLADIATMMTNSSRLLISTPNRRDVLMDLLPDDYPAFFYRTVHRWYFDLDSFSRCAELAGLRVVEGRCVHRFGLSNAMKWLRDRKPGGAQSLPAVNKLVDKCWQASLEQAGTGDYLYFWLEKAK